MAAGQESREAESPSATPEILALAERAVTGATPPVSVLIDREVTGLRIRHMRSFYRLYNWYGGLLLGLMVFQLLVGDLLFALYEWFGAHWRLDAAVIDAWLAFALAQVAGVVVIVVKHLFPDWESSQRS